MEIDVLILNGIPWRIFHGWISMEFHGGFSQGIYLHKQRFVAVQDRPAPFFSRLGRLAFADVLGKGNAHIKIGYLNVKYCKGME